MIVAMAAGAGLADEINISGLPYTDVKIVDFDGKTVSFQYLSRVIKKDISQVKSVMITDDKAFTKAEDLVDQGRAMAAISVYESALRNASEPWHKALIKHRLDQARAGAAATGTGGTGTGGTGTTKTNDVGAKKCDLCGGTGKTACVTCQVMGRATGRALCATCKGKGRTTCTQCGGKWKLDACASCDGEGKVATFAWKWNGAKRQLDWSKTLSLCPVCAGKGFSQICQACGGALPGQRGTAPCLPCKGAGVVAGVCPACKGARTASCVGCNGTGDPTKGVTVAVKPPDNGGTNGGTGTGGTGTGGTGTTVKPKHVPIAGPLGSPDAMVAALKSEPKHPSEDKAAWADLSADQRNSAEEAYAMTMVRWMTANEFHKAAVTWSVTFNSLGSALSGHVLTAGTSGGTVVTMPLSAEAAGSLKTLTKGDTIIIKGTVSKYAPVDPQAKPLDAKTVYGITVTPAAADPVVKG